MAARTPVAATQLSPGAERRRNAWISVATLVVAVGGLALAAPDAQADVQAITVAPGPSFGTSAQHGSGCTYRVTIAANPGTKVEFSDDALAAFDPPSPVIPSAGTVDIRWTPTAPGKHVIRARQGNQMISEAELINVAVGHDFGSTCWALPF